jgi:hypothetical protein
LSNYTHSIDLRKRTNLVTISHAKKKKDKEKERWKKEKEEGEKIGCRKENVDLVCI